MKSLQNNRRFSKRTVLFATVGTALLLTAGIVAFALKSDTTTTDKQTTGTRDVNSVDYSPASDEEKQASEDNKDKIVQNTNRQIAQGENASSSIKPIVTANNYDGSIEASAMVSGVFEDGGICTFSLKKGDANIEKKSTGERDARYTYCPVVTIPSSQLSKGSWSITATYSSQAGNGTSDTITVEVK